MTGRVGLRQKRGVVLGLVLPTALGIALLAVAINDAGHMVSAQVRAESVARAAAAAGADVWFRTHRQDLVDQGARAAAQSKDATVEVLWVDIDRVTGTVTVRVEKQAQTIAVDRISFLEQYATQGATESDQRTS